MGRGHGAPLRGARRMARQAPHVAAGRPRLAVLLASVCATRRVRVARGSQPCGVRCCNGSCGATSFSPAESSACTAAIVIKIVKNQKKKRKCDAQSGQTARVPRRAHTSARRVLCIVECTRRRMSRITDTAPASCGAPCATTPASTARTRPASTVLLSVILVKSGQ